MFAPNRLITVKEQWLLAGIIVVVLVGSVTLYMQGRGESSASAPFVLEAGSVPAPAAAAARPAPETAVSVPALAVPGTTDVEAAAVPPEEPPAQAPQDSVEIGVAVMGAVRNPGFYMVPEDFRVADLIGRAGGASATADLAGIALTAPLIDETTLTIPEKPVSIVEGIQLSARRGAASQVPNPQAYLKRSVHGPAPAQGNAVHPVPDRHTGNAVAASPQPAAPANSGGGLLNVNQATQAELEQLPGIGPVLAGAIIAERQRQPFSTVEELQRVHGIGEKRLAAIRSLITAP